MWQKLRALWPVGKKMMLALMVLGVGVLAFCWGRHGALSVAKANPPTDPVERRLSVLRLSRIFFGAPEFPREYRILVDFVVVLRSGIRSGYCLTSSSSPSGRFGTAFSSSWRF